jgi:hypothetical protein
MLLLFGDVCNHVEFQFVGEEVGLGVQLPSLSSALARKEGRLGEVS